MIIREEKGNAVTMYLEGEGHLIHGCNCFNSMGAGIAKEVKARVPGAAMADMDTKKGDKRKLGTNSIYSRTNGLKVFNAYTQYDFWGGGVKVDYDALRRCFHRACVDLILTKEKDTAHIPLITPLIGAGLAGGDWEKIRNIIDECTGLYPVIVVHFEPDTNTRG